MEFHRRAPGRPLSALVDHYWFFAGLQANHRVEHVVPDGTVELIIDLRDEPRRLFEREDPSRSRTFRSGWVSGAQSGYITIDVRPDASMIGVHFRPGGAGPLLGMPAEEITDQVVELASLWRGGGGTGALRDRLLRARGASAKFDLLEEFLLARLQQAPPLRWHPGRVAAALKRFSVGGASIPVASLAEDLGLSHKQFIQEFRRAVGLTPKRYSRICRFHDVLGHVRARRVVEWADVAVACGYYDQAHFVHDFKAFAGLNPSAFLARNLDDPKFIPIAGQEDEA